MEKCYREIQSRGQMLGLSIIEVFVLISIPIALLPFFTLLEINSLFIFAIEAILITIFRLANKVSHFDHGLISFVMSRFAWPQRLSAFTIDEKTYISDPSRQPLDGKVPGKR